MGAILRKLPFYEEANSLRIPNGPVIAIKPDQIIVWVSITPPGPEGPPTAGRRFPAVLDTGSNNNFLVREQHLVNWADLRPQHLTQQDVLSVQGQHVPVLEADVWLHRNIPGHRDQFTTEPPFRLELDNGVALCPDPISFPRLPLLGLRAVRQNRLELQVSGAKGQVWLRTPRRYWFFGW